MSPTKRRELEMPMDLYDELRDTINWFFVGEQDCQLSLTIANSDCEDEEDEGNILVSPRTQRDLLRAHIPQLNETQLRRYLDGIQYAMQLAFDDAM